jgi:hypothetical protein
MNNSVNHAPKNLRGKVTRNIISDLQRPIDETQTRLETLSPVQAKLEAVRKKKMEQKTELFAKGKKPAAGKPAVKSTEETAPIARSNESQNARISWMNDIVNAGVTLKGMKKSAPANWNREALSKLSNTELWKLRGEATRAATTANAATATKDSLTDKANFMKGNGGEKTTLESGKVRVHGTKSVKEADEPVVLSPKFFEDVKFSKDKTKVRFSGVVKKNLEVGNTLKFTLGAFGEDKVNYLCEVLAIDEAARTITALILEEANFKPEAKTEAATSGQDNNGMSLSICPLCGSAEFNTIGKKCPVCSESYNKYRAVEAADFNWEDEDQFTTIDIDGEEKVLLDENGNTSVISPDDIEGQFDESDEEPLAIDTGIATGMNETETPEGEEPVEADPIAFVKFPMSIEECVDLLQEENEDSVEVVPTDNGYEIIVSLESAEEEFEEEEDEFGEVEEDPMEATESIDDEFGDEGEPEGDMPFEDEVPTFEDEEFEEKGDEKIVLTLEELAEGTVIHAEGITSVESLIDIINQLLPQNAEIVEAQQDEDNEEVVEEDVQEMEDKKDEEVLEDDEEKLTFEAAKPKFGKVTKAKTKVRAKKIEKPKGFKVTESGTMKAMRNGEMVTFKVKSVYESALPKITKANPKTTGKVKADKKPGASSLAQTMEASTTKREFVKAGMEALGSALNTRKLLLSLWDAIKENKPGSSKTLLNTLEAAIKDPTGKKAAALKAKEEAKAAKFEKKPEAKPEVKKIKKLENKVKKLDKVVKFAK